MTEAMKKFSDNDWDEVCEPFASAVTGMTREVFTTRFPGRYLCVLLDAGSEDTPSFMTLGGDVPAHRSRRLQVFALAKRSAANPFSMMITFGRAPNNDLILELGQVSKFHGYFSKQGEDWYVTDAGSTNGTTVDGVALEVRKPTLISPGAEVLLGSVPAWSVDGAQLFDFLLQSKQKVA